MSRHHRIVIQPTHGCDFVLLAGLPASTFRFVQTELKRNRNRSPARYEGLPSSLNDWSDLYPSQNINTMLSQVGAFALRNEGQDTGKMPTPRRIILLFIPSATSEKLLESFDFACYPKPLVPLDSEWRAENANLIEWRHHRQLSLGIIERAIEEARDATNELKSRITDRKRSALSLPANNFHYPDRAETIAASYRQISRGEIPVGSIDAQLEPKDFDRDQLDPRAFKSSRSADRFYQDAKGRVFPPDPYHGRARLVEQPNSREKAESSDRQTLSQVLLVLRQRYRFGVVVRDGELHYDVQYERPRRLQNEEMNCGSKGVIWVSGSHANVGVNDVVWAPDGQIKSQGPT